MDGHKVVSLSAIYEVRVKNGLETMLMLLFMDNTGELVLGNWLWSKSIEEE